MAAVKFIEHTHQYFHDTQELTSVSVFAKQFEEWKDWYKIAQKYAVKNGHTAAYWQKLWKDKAFKSSSIGTICHNVKERELIESDYIEFEGISCGIQTCRHENELKWGIPITNLTTNTIYPELIIYDLDFNLCGQADKVIVTDTHINIGDYKTDKSIDFKGYSSTWKKAEKFKAPISHLDNCNGNMYALKMSLYMYMLWKQNRHLVPGKLFIEHITLKRDAEGIPILDDYGKPIILNEETILIPYLKREVMDMLKHYKEKTKKNGVR